MDKNQKEFRLLEEKLKLMEQERELRLSLPHKYLHPLYQWQIDYNESLSKTCIICAANQVGKVQQYSDEIYTTNGLKTIGTLNIGDFVFGRDGKPTEIVEFPFDGEQEFYKLTFDDNTSIEVGEYHNWICKTNKERFRKEYKTNFERCKNRGQKHKNKDYNKWITLTTKEIIEKGNYNPETIPYKRISIPVCEPVEYTHKNLFDPYLIGLIIGDGCITNGSVIITNKEKEIIKYLKKYAAKPTGKYGYRLNKLKPIIDKILGRAGSIEKNIPQDYLIGSINERKQLLSGLMDTDGYIDSRGNLFYCTISPTLRDTFIELINSLGGIVNKVREKRAFYTKEGKRIYCNMAYDIGFKLEFNPFTVGFKRERFRNGCRYRHERIIYKIEHIGKRKGRCLSVNNSDGSYLASRNYIVTHNSTTNIIKLITICTEKERWEKLWDLKVTGVPNLFWYLYPSQDLINIEFEVKWKKYLPKGKMKDDVVYGWTELRDGKDTVGIKFNSGIILEFKGYSQKLINIQSVTLFAVFTDEEMPFAYYAELRARLSATHGYFNMVFTATIGQDEWRRAVEERGENETFKEAFKRTISLYDCLQYANGEPGQYTERRIRQIINEYPDEAEINRRVFGRFAISEGLIYSSFSPRINVVKPYDIPNDWKIVASMDMGSGGSNHKAAIAFMAVRPDRKKACIFKGWKGNSKETTTEKDVIDRYVEMKRGLKVISTTYDYAAKELATIASSLGIGLSKANKSHSLGEGLLNTLFKNQMLDIFDIPELRPAITELMTVKHSTLKNKRDDDLTDVFRYLVCMFQWAFSDIKDDVIIKPEPGSREEGRLALKEGRKNVVSIDVQSEMDEWNEHFEV